MTATAALSRAADACYRTFGEAATFTDRNAVSTACTVIVQRDLDRYGESAVVNKRTAIVEVRVSELASMPRRGERFTLTSTGTIFTVDSAQYSDEFEHRVFVT